MITEYYRPEKLDEALTLINRNTPSTIVLGGGLYINEVIKEPIAVVDLQGLGLNEIVEEGKSLSVGAAVTLQSLLTSGLIPLALQKAITHQETYHRRQVATLGGTIVAANGRSPIAGVLLALDAELELMREGKKKEKLKLGDFLPLRQEKISGKLITSIRIPTEISASYHYVARSPADLPIVAAAAAAWPSGRNRVVLLGFGDQPVMVFDGPEREGAEIAARDAYSGAADQWGGGEYRSDIAGVLTKRCLDEMTGNNEG
jgi:probable selenate reductase FAD-binding subunit